MEAILQNRVGLRSYALQAFARPGCCQHTVPPADAAQKDFGQAGGGETGTPARCRVSNLRFGDPPATPTASRRNPKGLGAGTFFALENANCLRKSLPSLSNTPPGTVEAQRGPWPSRAQGAGGSPPGTCASFALPARRPLIKRATAKTALDAGNQTLFCFLRPLLPM